MLFKLTFWEIFSVLSSGGFFGLFFLLFFFSSSLFLLSPNFQVNNTLFVPWDHFLLSQTINDGFRGCFSLAFAFLHNLFLNCSLLFVSTSVALEAFPRRFGAPCL